MKNMKKLLALTSLILLTNSIFAGGDENEIKNFRFGLKVTPSLNWYKPDGKILEKNGISPKFGGGLVLEFRLAKVASVQTGLQIDMDGGKIKYNNGGITVPNANIVSYYYNNSDDVIEPYGLAAPDPSDSTNLYSFNQKYTLYQLNERTYKATYITIPLLLKLKTKEIGMMTYFGQFGINNSFRWSVKADDKLTASSGSSFGATESKSKINVSKDASFYAASLAFGGGVEMNFSGTTSLLLGINYNLGFTNVVKSQSDYLRRTTNNSLGNGSDLSQLPQTLKSNAVVLTIGVLF
jgi:hypothetical protein